MATKRIAAVLQTAFDPHLGIKRSYYVVTEADGTVWTPVWFGYNDWATLHTDLQLVQWGWSYGSVTEHSLSSGNGLDNQSSYMR